MALLNPPPTYVSPVIINEVTGEGVFNPIWLKWFVDLAGTVNTGGGTVLVAGPASSTDNAVVRWSGILGNTIQNSGVTIDDSSNVVIPGTVSFAKGITVDSETITDSDTLDSADYIIICNKATAMTVTLPAAAAHTGRVYEIKNINVGAVTVDGNASETIDGVVTQVLSQYDSITISCDGSNWHIL